MTPKENPPQQIRGDEKDERIRRFVHDSMAFQERVRAACRNVRSVSELSRRAGVSEGTIRKWAQGESEPTRDRLLAFATAAGVDPHWLMDGAGLPQVIQSGIPDNLRTGSAHSTDLSTPSEYTLIPRKDVLAAAGDAVLVPAEEVIDYILFRTDYLRRELGLDPKNLTVIQAKGDSMEPTIQNGDLLLVDVSQAHEGDNAIYVLNIDGRLLVKRLHFRLDGTIRVTSENPKYEAEVVKAGDDKVFRLVGRVVWVGGRM